MHDLNKFISDIRAVLPPHLLPLFETMAEEAIFGRAWMDSDLKALPVGAKILEIGGGVFILSCQLVLEGYTVTSIEPSGCGFGAFRELGEKVLETAKKFGPIPSITDCFVEDFKSPERFSYAFSINVMEHVNNPEAAMNRVLAVLEEQACYRFVCPNYIFPYEPHFNIPTLFTKSLTEKFFSNRIFDNSQIDDPKGLWQSLNWITVFQVRQLAFDSGILASFKKDTIVWMLKRATVKSAFATRRAKWMRQILILAEKCKIIGLARYIPALLQPIMDCRVVRKA